MEYTKQMLIFTDISSKKASVDFNGGEITSDTGLLFLREVEKRTGIIKKLSRTIRDNRHQSYTIHDIYTLLRQRIFQIASGYEDGNDCDELRTDPSLKFSCDRLPISGTDLASQPTMCRLENTITRTDLYRIAQVFLELFIDSYKRPPTGIIIDIDDTDDPAHGSQQLTLFNAYHNTYCYMPIHIYEGKSGKLITSILRPGKRPDGKEIVAILKRIVKRIRKSWPEVGIIFRGDSHYSTPEVHDYCTAHNVKFVLGQTPNAVLYEKAQSIIEKAKELYSIDKNHIKLFSEFNYQAQSWSQPRRIIVKAEYTKKGANTRFIVTNLTHNNCKFIYNTIYCGRGNMELNIKEHKNHLASDRTSCTSFQANQFRLFLHSAAYVLLHTFRAQCLKATEFAHAQFNTIRLKLLKIGAQVREMITRVKFHLPSSFPFKPVFIQICQSFSINGFT